MSKNRPEFSQHLEGLTEEEKLNMLEAHYAKKTQMELPYHFTESQRQSMKNQLATDMIHVKKHDDILKAARDLHKENTKENKERIKNLTRDLQQGYEIQMQDVYMIDDQDEGIMYFYTAAGKLIDQRPLTSEERQSRIRPL